MNAMLDLELAREHNRVLLREAERWQLARKLREARKATKAVLLGEEASEPVNRDIEVRWGLPEDEPRIAELLELNGMPRRMAFEGQFVVAEEHGEVLAAVRYRTVSKRLTLDLLVADPWAGERGLAVALYAGARDLAREMGVQEIRAESVGHADYPHEAGYRRRAGQWRLDTSLPYGGRDERPARGRRRLRALRSMAAAPLFRTFRG